MLTRGLLLLLAQNTEYVCVSGAKRKVETWDAKDSEGIELKGADEAERLATDPMYRAEHGMFGLVYGAVG